jgi:hypothetical protein
VAGKEMSRLKSLNVMGQRSSMKGQIEVGCTPQGPRVPSFGSGAEYAQQQSLMNMRSPQMQMQMLMSGSMPGSAYKESYRSGWDFLVNHMLSATPIQHLAGTLSVSETVSGFCVACISAVLGMGVAFEFVMVKRGSQRPYTCGTRALFLLSLCWSCGHWRRRLQQFFVYFCLGDCLVGLMYGMVACVQDFRSISGVSIVLYLGDTPEEYEEER